LWKTVIKKAEKEHSIPGPQLRFLRIEDARINRSSVQEAALEWSNLSSTNTPNSSISNPGEIFEKRDKQKIKHSL